MIGKAVAATTSAATPEAIATLVVNTSATVLEATATVRNEVVTQEDPAIARQVEEALTLVPSHAANSSNAARVVESSNHLQFSVAVEAELVRRPMGEPPIVALAQAEGMAPAPSNPATCTSPTHVIGNNPLRHRKPLIDVADILALRDPRSPFPLD